jgi:hypothetical protein
MPPSVDHVCLAQVQFDDDSGLPRDRSINTFHFVDIGDPAITPPTAALDEYAVAIRDFYTAAHTGSTSTLSTFLSSTLAGTWTTKFYDLHDAPPRSPLRVDTMTPLTPGSTAMPQENALCISYQAAHLSGFNQANRRGRIYIGPLAQTALGSVAARPNANANQLVPTAVAAGAFLKGHSWAAGTRRWVVYSQKFGTWATVTDGWVDNEFDTQRRRGYRPTTRTTF